MAGQISIRDTQTETRVFSKRAVLAAVVVVLAACGPGSYTHLTLPTILRVSESVFPSS